jgi:hypothetical protein
MSHSRMMAEHFGISILESDAKLLHERIQLLITEAYNRGVQHEREACARVCESLSLEWADQAEIAQAELATMLDCAQAIRARSQA